jgi:hypothetical protein
MIINGPALRATRTCLPRAGRRPAVPAAHPRVTRVSGGALQSGTTSGLTRLCMSSALSKGVNGAGMRAELIHSQRMRLVRLVRARRGALGRESGTLGRWGGTLGPLEYWGEALGRERGGEG